jgi:hypothetical protein
MVANLERSGKFDQARMHYMRADSVKACCELLSTMSGRADGEAPFSRLCVFASVLTKLRNTLSLIFSAEGARDRV